MGKSNEADGSGAIKRSAKEAKNLQSQITSQTLADPLFNQRRDLVQGIVNDPLTFGPEQRELMFRQGASLANQAATDFVDDSLARATGPQGAGARSGSIVNANLLAGAGLGEALASAQRQVSLAGAQQDRADLTGAIDLIANQTAFQNAPQQAEVQTLLGQGQLLTGIPQTQQQAGPGAILGSITGSFLGGPGGGNLAGKLGGK